MIDLMARLVFLLAILLGVIATLARGDVVEQTFNVGNLTVRRLCSEKVIVAVNQRSPGPTIVAREGDTVIIHVINNSPYNVTIHWHGIFQLMSQWADGPSFVTQCPIQPGNKYTYRFNITGQEGTLWYHAHVSFLRATVYGALIIRPRTGSSGYPFPKPDDEVPIVLGEWWNANVVDVEAQALAVGGIPNISDAYTINGKPGDLYSCSDKNIFKFNVTKGKTYLLRIINAALNNQLFFKIAGHSLTVVGFDASYTTPHTTDFVVLAPGNTVDALLVADAPPANYYMAARSYFSAGNSTPIPFDNTTTTGILQYDNAPAASTFFPPVMPDLPDFFDTPMAYKFCTSLTALDRPGAPKVPLEVDEKMFITYGLGLVPCDKKVPCTGPSGQAFAASMNNISFQLPTRMSLLQAHVNKVGGIFTPDFPDRPPVVFNYTDVNVAPAMFQTRKGTSLKKLKFNSRVEVVLQDTAVMGAENHPIHLHGLNFFVLAMGFGNYDAAAAEQSFDLVRPLVMNTVAVPVGGWAVIRFVANNPGVWIMHCHLDVHLPMGLATGFVVEDGPTPETTLPPPPLDFPAC